MKTKQISTKPVIIGIMGGRDASPAMQEEARLLGEAIAGRGYILLTGGGPGIMRAASEGAHRAGGLVIAILPNDRNNKLTGYPNEYVDIPVYTGMSDARNAINARTPHVLIALEGGAGTLSEIALALKVKTPVIGLRAPSFEVSGDYDFTIVETVAAALEQMERILDAQR